MEYVTSNYLYEVNYLVQIQLPPRRSDKIMKQEYWFISSKCEERVKNTLFGWFIKFYLLYLIASHLLILLQRNMIIRFDGGNIVPEIPIGRHISS